MSGAHDPKAVENICIKELFILWLAFNPGLGLRRLPTTQP